MKETHEHAVKRGKKSKASGSLFELRVRKDLEERWIVSKWPNNVELFCELEGAENQGGCKNVFKGKLIPAKTKWMFTKQGPRPAGLGSGFPDFIAFRPKVTYRMHENGIDSVDNKEFDYEVIGVEAKSNGYLDPAERKKCEWLLKNKVFSKILIAKKTKVKNKILVEYTEFDNNI